MYWKGYHLGKPNPTLLRARNPFITTTENPRSYLQGNPFGKSVILWRNYLKLGMLATIYLFSSGPLIKLKRSFTILPKPSLSGTFTILSTSLDLNFFKKKKTQKFLICKQVIIVRS